MSSWHRPLEDDKAPWRCRTCFHALDTRTLQDGREVLEHGALPDHVPPHVVDPEQIRDEHDVLAVCDFCTAPIPLGQEWDLPAASFTYCPGEGLPAHNLINYWACCPACAPLVRERDLDGLYERWAAEDHDLRVRVGMDQASRWIIGLWEVLFEHYTLGEPFPSSAPADGQHRHSGAFT